MASHNSSFGGLGELLKGLFSIFNCLSRVCLPDDLFNNLLYLPDGVGLEHHLNNLLGGCR